jgi:N-acetylglucosamine-6-phosphate deacetylase
VLVESAKSLQENDWHGSKLLGIHFEGPFVNPEKRGVLDERYLANPSIELADLLFSASQSGSSKTIFTIAPEIPRAIEIGESLHKKGAIISAGHTDATYEQAKLAFSSGFTHVTHLFNAMRPLSARDPGIIGAALEDDEVSVEMIADGHHVSPSVIRMVLRAKPMNEVATVSDASPCAGLGEGEFTFGDRRFIVRDGVARMENGGLAGSVEFQHRGLVLGVQEIGASLVAMAKLLSETPSRIVGRKDIGVLQAGASADIVLLDGTSLDVVGTLVDGRLNEGNGP